MLGLLAGAIRWVEDLLDPWVAAVYPIPKSALFPLFMLWFGLGNPSNIFTGLRLGAGMALILVFITEIEATKAGLGFLLWEAFQLMDTRHVFVGVVTFGLLGVATTWLLQWLERVTCPWIQRSN